MEKYYIYNILLGIILGYLIGKLNIKKQIYHGPNSLDIKNKIFIFNKKCFKLKPYIIKCPLFSYHN